MLSRVLVKTIEEGIFFCSFQQHFVIEGIGEPSGKTGLAHANGTLHGDKPRRFSLARFQGRGFKVTGFAH